MWWNIRKLYLAGIEFLYSILSRFEFAAWVFSILTYMVCHCTIQENYPKLSADVAGDRKFDVYMGIDVFGRNTYGGGQWNVSETLNPC